MANNIVVPFKKRDCQNLQSPSLTINPISKVNIIGKDPNPLSNSNNNSNQSNIANSHLSETLHTENFNGIETDGCDVSGTSCTELSELTSCSISEKHTKCLNNNSDVEMLPIERSEDPINNHSPLSVSDVESPGNLQIDLAVRLFCD